MPKNLTLLSHPTIKPQHLHGFYQVVEENVTEPVLATLCGAAPIPSVDTFGSSARCHPPLPFLTIPAIPPVFQTYNSSSGVTAVWTLIYSKLRLIFHADGTDQEKKGFLVKINASVEGGGILSFSSWFFVTLGSTDSYHEPSIQNVGDNLKAALEFYRALDILTASLTATCVSGPSLLRREGKQHLRSQLTWKFTLILCKAGETHFLGLWPGASKLQSEEQQDVLLLWLCHGELSFNLFILTWRYPEQMDMDWGCFFCCFSFHWHWQKVRLTCHWWSLRFTKTNDPPHIIYSLLMPMTWYFPLQT